MIVQMKEPICTMKTTVFIGTGGGGGSDKFWLYEENDNIQN
jgi:hypothetical protein